MSEALDLLFALRLEDGRCWGDVATGMQREDAAAVLGAAPEPYNFLTRARGWSKTSDLAATTVVAMVKQLPDAARLFAAAADQDQARLLIDAVGGFARRTPGLGSALRVDSYRVVAERGGQVLEALAADAAGTWGLRPDWIVLDELGQWPSTPSARQLFEALTSAAAKVDTCRMAVITTASDPAHWSRGVLDHALADPLWRVREVAGPPPWMDAARIAEQRRRLPESVFARLFENRWVSGEDRLVSVDDLRACVTLNGPLPPVRGASYVVGVDVGLKRDATVACVCHLSGGVVTLDRIATWQGTRERPVRLGDVEAWLARTSREYRAPIVIDPYQAAQLAERLRNRGVRVTEFVFGAQSVGRLASTLYLLLREHAVHLPDDAELIDELSHVRLRETSPGVMRMHHDSSRHDDRAVALALAAHWLVQRGERRPTGRALVPRSRIPKHTIRAPRQVDELLWGRR